MSESIHVKRDLRQRYDGFGRGVLDSLRDVRDAATVWRRVEGERPALAYFRHRKIETVLDLARFRPGNRILEVGCGTGDYSFLLARRGFKMVGADLSPLSIEGAKEKALILGQSDLAFVVSDAESLGEVPQDSVEGVVSFSTLRYVPNLERALQAIWRVLRPGGVAVLDFPNRFCPWFRLLKNRFGVETHIHDHQYSSRQIAVLMREAGFRDVEVRRILFTPYVLPAPLLPLFRCIDWIGERTPLINTTAAILMARGTKS